MERNHPGIYNKDSLATNKALVAQIEAEAASHNEPLSEDDESDEDEGPDEKMETDASVPPTPTKPDGDGQDSDSSDSTPSPQKKKVVIKSFPGGIKASTRTNLRKSASNQIGTGPDEKHRPSGTVTGTGKKSRGQLPARPIFKPPSSRIRPLPNPITPKTEPIAPPPPPKTILKPTKPRLIKSLKVKQTPSTDKKKSIAASASIVIASSAAAASAHQTSNLVAGSGTSILNFNQQPAPIRTYGSKSKILLAPGGGESSLLLGSGADLGLTLPSPSAQVELQPTIIASTPTSSSTSGGHNYLAGSVSVPPKQVVFTGRNLARSLMVQTPVTNNQSLLTQNQKSTPILIRSLNPSQLQQQSTQSINTTTGTTVIQTSSGGNITIPTSGMQFTVGPSATGQGFALVNIRGGLPAGTVLRSGNLAQSLTGSQVVRFLQQSGILLQQPAQGQGGGGGGTTTLPLTVRLPVSAVQQTVQVTQGQGQGQQQSSTPTMMTITSTGSPSAAVCSTASAIYSANSTAVRLARGSVGSTGGVTQFQLVSRSPNTGAIVSSGGTVTTTNTLARTTPISAVGGVGNRAVRPGGTPPGTPTTGIRTATLTASQLRSALAGGTHAVIRTSGGGPGNIATLRTSTGQNIPAGGVRAISISNAGVARAVVGQGTSPRTASGMLRPVTIATAGMRGKCGENYYKTITKFHMICKQLTNFFLIIAAGIPLSRPLNASVRATVAGGQQGEFY